MDGLERAYNKVWTCIMSYICTMHRVLLTLSLLPLQQLMRDEPQMYILYTHMCVYLFTHIYIFNIRIGIDLYLDIEMNEVSFTSRLYRHAWIIVHFPLLYFDRRQETRQESADIGWLREEPSSTQRARESVYDGVNRSNDSKSILPELNFNDLQCFSKQSGSSIPPKDYIFVHQSIEKEFIEKLTRVKEPYSPHINLYKSRVSKRWKVKLGRASRGTKTMQNFKVCWAH